LFEKYRDRDFANNA
jgi:hypothetical protein